MNRKPKKSTGSKPKDMRALGRKGGQSTLRKRGSAFYSRIAKKRKVHAGGRPKKLPENGTQEN